MACELARAMELRQRLGVVGVPTADDYDRVRGYITGRASVRETGSHRGHYFRVVGRRPSIGLPSRGTALRRWRVMLEETGHMECCHGLAALLAWCGVGCLARRTSLREEAEAGRFVLAFILPPELVATHTDGELSEMSGLSLSLVAKWRRWLAERVA